MYSMKLTSPFSRYGFAVLVVGVALGTRLLLDPVIPQNFPFLLLFGAVMVSAWYGGLGPGLLTMVLAGLATNYLFLRPQETVSTEAIPLLVFFAESTLVCLLAEALRTARRRAETSKAEAERDRERLRRSEEQFHSLVEGMREHAIFTLDPQGRVTNWNAERLTGYTSNEVVGQHFSVFFTSTDIERARPQSLLEEASKQGRSREEGAFVRRDGSRFRADTTTTALHDERGKLRGFSVITRDITGQKETEEALKRSLDVQLALYETGSILGSSLQWEEIGSRLLEVVRRVSNLTAVVISVPDENGELSIWRSSGLDGLWRRARFAPEALSARRKVLRTREHGLLRLRRPGEPEEHLVSVYLPLLVQDRLIGVLEAYGPDTPVDEGAESLFSLATQAASALENARLYTELSERENQLRDLVGKLIMAQEEERRRVAYDIHDGLAQSAAAAHQHLQAFARHHTICSAQDQEELDEALELVRELVGEARQVIYDLRPTVLDDFGLAAAVRLQVATLRADGLEIALEESLGDGRLPQEVETTLFRVTQEALTNIRKHARATKARVVLDRPGNEVRLLVSDGGRGFVPNGGATTNGRGEKVGLSGMRERVSLLGGKFELHSEPGRGTSIEARVALPETGEEPPS
jgi:PAS domain S-box-containing protein